jgi:molybdate transport system substrate-binding protein
MRLLSKLGRCVLSLAMLAAGVVHADELAVLSAGAVEPGLRAAVGAFEQQTGHKVKLTFNTAPELKKRMDGNEPFDVVIAPRGAISEFAAANKLAEVRAMIGRVGMGVAVREGVPAPDIRSADALKQSVLAAESVVFNRASTGLYLEGLLKKMDIYPQVEAKATRYPDGAAVMEHVIRGKGNEIGFGAITEIMLYDGKGLRFVGPVPAEVQNYTTYAAATIVASDKREAAQSFVIFLEGPVGKPLFVAAGITD